MADTIVTSAGSTAVTENEVISSIVQDELKRQAKLRPTVRDYSSMVGKGDKSLHLPKWTTSFAGPAAQNPDGETTVDFQAPVFGEDVLLLDKWVNLPYRIPDRVSIQSKINVEAELAVSAGKDMGNYMDDLIITELRLPSTSAPDHLIDLDGSAASGSATAITLEGITEARKLLNKQNIEAGNRYLVISPEQEKEMLNISNFIKANEYGAREGLLEGEIGRVFGFTVMVHNGLNDNEAFAYHKDAVGIAVQREVKFESQRADVRLQATDYSFSLGMGAQVLQGGKLQVHMLGA